MIGLDSSMDERELREDMPGVDSSTDVRELWADVGCVDSLIGWAPMGIEVF